MVEELFNEYRRENANPEHHNSKPFKTKKVRCEAVDLSGKPVEGDCVICESHFTNNGKGYSRLRVGDKALYLHRLLWELANGCEIPEGYEVDHICENKACINPKHLQVLSGESHRLKTQMQRGCLGPSTVVFRKLIPSFRETFGSPVAYEVWAR